ncbi:hypothetical protein I6F35_32020 [Bradyrhizobium sp. BRP22]|uniref:hypothetical protein n=1 Tax=Bradyrhizobium sp. BRP22 TaxID=2793821 RepID=UPI001CD3447F|nr:hypothetical protein [Bradyrhizobium sp. BRP22]MCA1457759.1 hypothetical protein [Bradyrhizobium sp. BRP22]
MIKRLSPLTLFKLADKETEWRDLERSSDPITPDLPHHAEISQTGLFMPPGLHIEQWKAIGKRLMTIETGIQWALGDWWVYGHHNYGNRAEAAKKLPYEFGSLMNLGTVARKFPPSLRNEALSFSHHVAVAALEPNDRVSWLKKAAAMHWSVKRLRDELDKQEPRKENDYDRARRWAYDFVAQAERQKVGLGYYNVDSNQLDQLEDNVVTELVESSTSAANTWAELATVLKRYQQRRTDKSKRALPRERLDVAAQIESVQ